ncbi:MAG: alanine racemase [Pseudorhodoplanes sp.]|nr:alanine racemase [Pseudorhodoplanes sp.]
MAGPPAEEACGILTIDLAALAANWQALRALATPAECAAVVKANGYGLGLEQVAARLQRAGCRTFFVADLSEGQRARSVLPEATIYVLNGIPPGTCPVYAEHRLQPVIGDVSELAEWDTFVDTSGWSGEFALHVNTGMNRLGITVEEAVGIAPRLSRPEHGITLLVSHFVASEIPSHPRNQEQILAFRELRSLFRGVPASLSNSSGIFLGASAICDLVRPGAALCGVNPTPTLKNPMLPVVDLKSRIVQVRSIPFGQTVGYDATWTARRASRIAVISTGYADGYFRSASGSDQKPGGVALIAGRRCPIVGRISMDLMALDITDLPEHSVRRGDFATLIGDGLPVDEVAEFAGTIGYEVLTSLGRRYARIYLDDAHN